MKNTARQNHEPAQENHKSRCAAAEQQTHQPSNEKKAAQFHPLTQTQAQSSEQSSFFYLRAAVARAAPNTQCAACLDSEFQDAASNP